MTSIKNLLAQARGKCLLALVMGAWSLVGCYAEHPPNRAATPLVNGEAGATGDADADAGNSGNVICLPPQVEASERLPARSEVMTADATPKAQRVFVKDLFSLFAADCGACHVESNQGGFQGQKVTLQNFAALVNQDAIDAIFQTDPTKIMPPSSKAPDTRPATDTVLHLGNLLKAWLGNSPLPTDSFWLEPDTSSGVSLLKLSKDVGSAMTNLGNCIPDKAFVGVETQKAKDLDDKFKALTTLPPNLSDTDLFTLDSAELARYGVVAFAPGYPLWADDAKKVRMVRVPVGSSIEFDQKKQKFTIPDYTRFYKTFLKQVKDVNGNVTFKKIETRLIVSRPDQCDANGQNCTPQALFGTYAWDEGETRADLVQDLLRDETPFADRLITYVTDEQKAADPSVDPDSAGITRRYAIPGSTRCTQCHMGSVSQSFILGFAPLQIRRQATGTDGVIEDTGADELNQFQRLVEYGIITSTSDPAAKPADVEAQIPNLKDAEGDPPRNDYELAAQGYMMGNCAHCHNPRGFPSVQHPELINMLDFWPRSDGSDGYPPNTLPSGGIFNFPIDRVSPRTHRGLSAEYAVPYITESIQDVDYGIDVPEGTSAGLYAKVMTFPTVDPVTGSNVKPILAPWRSLIYRNVDTPFTYTEASAVFPHMPLNTPGYDCRTARILGDWMVSIPVKRTAQGPEKSTDILPFVEVLPGQAFYAQKVSEASDRLDQYHSGLRYNFCPGRKGGDPNADPVDIRDPEVESGQAIVPQDNGFVLPGYTQAQVDVLPDDQKATLLWKDNVPDRPHWVITDPTEAPGAWVPRRPDYSPALFGDPSDPPCQTACASDQICDQGSCKTVSPELAVVTKVLGQGTIRFSSAFNDFALHQLPMAYWVVKPECSAVLQAEQKPTDFTGDDRLPWLDAHGTPDPTAPVYTTSIGATVFDEICRNCHGPNADGKSANADTILAMTGGTTRVADLRDGLLGPAGDPNHAGDNRALQFAREANRHELSPDDVAVRYLAWMALGGTEKVIPDAVLIAVQNSPVFGEYRHFAIGSPPPPTANMLASARLYCRSLLFHQSELDVNTGWIPEKGYDGTPLLTTNGDADMWRRLCYFENPGPIWGLTGEFNNPDDPNSADDWRGVQLSNSRFHRSAYPANTPVGGDHGVVSATLTDDNAVPWCFMPPPPSVDAGIYQAHLQAFWASQGRTDAIPYCPMDALTGQDVQDEIDGSDTEWELRAAANAGRSVFAYIDSVAKGFTPKVHNTECDLLLQSTKSN